MNNRNSKATQQVEHDEGASNTMRITFRSGEVYDYPGVRLSEAVDLAWSDKPGRYFQKHFRNRESIRVGVGAEGSSPEVMPCG